MKDIFRSAYIHWHSSVTAGIINALPVLCTPMLLGEWPRAEDYPKGVAQFLIGAYLLNMKRPDKNNTPPNPPALPVLALG